MKEGTPVAYITRVSAKFYTENGTPMYFTREIVLRGIWDGEKAVLTEKFDPRGLQTIVKKQEWLIQEKI